MQQQSWQLDQVCSSARVLTNPGVLDRCLKAKSAAEIRFAPSGAYFTLLYLLFDSGRNALFFVLPM